MPFKKKKKRKVSLYRPHGKTRTSQSFVPLCATAMSISVSFKSDCPSRFVHGRRASIPLLDSVRNRRAECHIESRVIPADDPHTPPLFEGFLQSLQTQLNLAHKHPITPFIPSQLAYGIEDGVTDHHSPRHPRSSPTWTLTCQHLPISPLRQRELALCRCRHDVDDARNFFVTRRHGSMKSFARRTIEAAGPS